MITRAHIYCSTGIEIFSLYNVYIGLRCLCKLHDLSSLCILRYIQYTKRMCCTVTRDPNYHTTVTVEVYHYCSGLSLLVIKKYYYYKCDNVHAQWILVLTVDTCCNLWIVFAISNKLLQLVSLVWLEL